MRLSVKIKNESGRSLTEMLATLAVIGILSVAGIAGYKMAMEMYYANVLLFEANQYAAHIYVNKKAHPDTFGKPHFPTAEDFGLDTLHLGAYPTANYMKENGVELDLHFYDVWHCRYAARLSGAKCNIVADGATCSAQTGNTKPVQGCFTYLFQHN